MVTRLVSTRIRGVLALAVACWLGTARAEVIFNRTDPVTTTVENPCTGELVSFTGEIHLISRVTEDAAGGLHVGFHANLHAHGVGAVTGDEYVMQHISTTSSSPGAPFPTAATTSATFHVVSTGPSPDFIIRAVSHLTVNANGEVTAFFDDFKTECIP